MYLFKCVGMVCVPYVIYAVWLVFFCVHPVQNIHIVMCDMTVIINLL